MQSKRECEVSGWQEGLDKCHLSKEKWPLGLRLHRRGGAGAAIRHSNLPFRLQLWCERVNPENKAALEAWVRETGIRLVQVNGQRKYGGPPPGTVAPALPRPGSTSLDGPPPAPSGGGACPSALLAEVSVRCTPSKQLRKLVCGSPPTHLASSREGASLKVHLLCASPVVSSGTRLCQRHGVRVLHPFHRRLRTGPLALGSRARTRNRPVR